MNRSAKQKICCKGTKISYNVLSLSEQVHLFVLAKRKRVMATLFVSCSNGWGDNGMNDKGLNWEAVDGL